MWLSLLEHGAMASLAGATGRARTAAWQSRRRLRRACSAPGIAAHMACRHRSQCRTAMRGSSSSGSLIIWDPDRFLARKWQRAAADVETGAASAAMNVLQTTTGTASRGGDTRSIWPSLDPARRGGARVPPPAVTHMSQGRLFFTLAALRSPSHWPDRGGGSGPGVITARKPPTRAVSCARRHALCTELSRGRPTTRGERCSV